jgi:hypothetical protein
MNRTTLFRNGKPTLRQFVSHDGDELGPDMGILWAAYKRGSFDIKEMDERSFAEFTLASLSRYSTVWIMEDRNNGFRSGSGPVCVIGVNSNGWMITPKVFWFSWATKRNKLRCTVAFFQKTRYEKTVGVCEVRTEQDGLKLTQHAIKFVPSLRYVGKIWFGTPNGDQFIFSVKGAKHAGVDGNRKDADGVQRDRASRPAVSGSEERESVSSGSDIQGVEERNGDV